MPMANYASSHFTGQHSPGLGEFYWQEPVCRRVASTSPCVGEREQGDSLLITTLKDTQPPTCRIHGQASRQAEEIALISCHDHVPALISQTHPEIASGFLAGLAMACIPCPQKRKCNIWLGDCLVERWPSAA